MRKILHESYSMLIRKNIKCVATEVNNSIIVLVLSTIVFITGRYLSVECGEGVQSLFILHGIATLRVFRG